MIDSNVFVPAFAWDSATGKTRQAEALAGLGRLVHRFPNFDQPALTLKPRLKMMWLENVAFESLLHARIDPDVALGTHDCFFRFQREDGLFPCILGATAKEPQGSAFGRFGMIQQNVPLARTA
jgi:hypothetical protein